MAALLRADVSFLGMARMLLAVCVVGALVYPGIIAFAQAPLDPAAWGSDHVGKPLPNSASGDECLFCHRDVGPGWPTNRHGQTVRAVDADLPALKELARLPQLKTIAADAELMLGGKRSTRFLRRSAEHGRLDLLATDSARWDKQTFGARCAGCHASGVDSAKQNFTAISLDCFVCHGEVPDKHTTQGWLALLSPHRKDSAAIVTSICAQCHLRGGASKSSGLPYPNNFVAGDNLFRDFRIDLSVAAIDKLNPGDRHVQENVRDVVLLGREGVTCLSCHDVHQQSAKKHHIVADGAICLNCHTAESKKVRVPYEVHSKTCDY